MHLEQVPLFLGACSLVSGSDTQFASLLSALAINILLDSLGNKGYSVMDAVTWIVGKFPEIHYPTGSNLYTTYGLKSS